MLNIRLWALALAGAILVPALNAETITENFTSNPAADGWQGFGNTHLFTWDSTNHDLIVTWDSSQSNSYFFHPLQNVLGEQDAFTLSFDLTLSNAVATGPNGFQVSIGFLHLADATNAGFLRGTGYQSPNLVEFDFFPAYTYGTNSYPPSIDATLVDEDENFIFFYDYTKGLSNGVTYHVEFNHPSTSPIVSVNVYTNGSGGQPGLYSSLPYSYVGPGFTDYFVDAIAVSSYNDLDAGGSILATGTVGNISVTTTPRAVGIFAAGFDGTAWQAQFSSRTNWFYTLNRSTDLKSWAPVSPTTIGTGDIMTLTDPNPPSTQAFYNIDASQP
jgi:hypothetical protein